MNVKTFLLLFSFALTMMADSMTVSLKTLEFPGLQVVLATDRSVQVPVATALGDNPAPEILDLLPYSLVLKNNTGHRISAYTLRLSFVDAADKSGGHNRQYFNLESSSNGMEMSPGATRLVTPTVSLDATVRQTARSGTGPSGARGVTERLRSQVAVIVALDLIVFDTGQVIGPDEGNTLSYLEGYLTGELEAASLADTALRRDASIQWVSDQLNQLITSVNKQPSEGLAALARANQARTFLRFASSKEALQREANRVLAKPRFTLYR